MIILSNTDSAMVRAGSMAQFVTVLVIFFLVLFVTVFVTKWLGNYQKSQGRSGNIEIIETARISPSVCVEIVRIGNKYAALSVSKDSSSLIMELSPEDIDLSGSRADGQGSFADIIKSVREKMRPEGSDEGAKDLQDE